MKYLQQFHVNVVNSLTKIVVIQISLNKEVQILRVEEDVEAYP